MTSEGTNKGRSGRPSRARPPAASPADPVGPTTHHDGGTYAEGDFSVAAQRSKLHTDQYQPGPAHLGRRTVERRSSLEDAAPNAPVGGQSTE